MFKIGSSLTDCSLPENHSKCGKLRGRGQVSQDVLNKTQILQKASESDPSDGGGSCCSKMKGCFLMAEDLSKQNYAFFSPKERRINCQIPFPLQRVPSESILQRGNLFLLWNGKRTEGTNNIRRRISWDVTRNVNQMDCLLVYSEGYRISGLPPLRVQLKRRPENGQRMAMNSRTKEIEMDPLIHGTFARFIPIEFHLPKRIKLIL